MCSVRALSVALYLIQPLTVYTLTFEWLRSVSSPAVHACSHYYQINAVSWMKMLFSVRSCYDWGHNKSVHFPMITSSPCYACMLGIRANYQHVESVCLFEKKHVMKNLNPTVCWGESMCFKLSPLLILKGRVVSLLSVTIIQISMDNPHNYDTIC